MKCALCGKRFEPKAVRKGPSAPKYCSPTCRFRAAHVGKPLEPLKPVKCAVCKTLFTPTRPSQQAYCSAKCRSHAAYVRRKEDGYLERYYKARRAKKAREEREQARKAAR